MRASFDVAVIGLGHAGAEAALAAARLGASVAALTQVPERACLMSCNPAIGGPGKSQLVREIDALGGGMAAAADATALQVRLLNRSKGPAGWATRMQVDRLAYAKAMQQRLAAIPGLEVVRGEAAGLALEAGQICGVKLGDGALLKARAVIVTTGTFLAARMHVGRAQSLGGRSGDDSSEGLSSGLRALGVALGRFKTGTPPRLRRSSIAWSRCEEQPSETGVGPLSRRTAPAAFPTLPQRSTYLTRTCPETHAVVLAGLDDSPLTTGALSGRGPRYCPSLEQKVLHYPERSGHLVYLEPDGLDADEIYPAGLSTSLPIEVQIRALRTIAGLEAVELARPGYAVEYDYLTAGQLRPSLELTALPGLFFAGQINGSSGYEEAAGQGLLAGVNAARSLGNLPPWIPDPSQCYLGVLCDDLINRRFEEPYRLLPGRTEHRLALREDNAAVRMVPTGVALGLLTAAEADPILRLKERTEEAAAGLSAAEVRWLRHPKRQLQEACESGAPLGALDLETARALFIETRYSPYQWQRRVAAERLGAAADLPIPGQLDPGSVLGLSAEARDALRKGRPRRLGEAAGLAGITPDAISLLAAHLRRSQRLRSVSRGTTP